MGMDKKLVTIFGDAIRVADKDPVACSLKFEVAGTIHDNYGVETIFLVVAIQVSGLTITKKLEIAKGTAGYGYNKPYRKELFQKLHNFGFLENQTKELSSAILEMYDNGQVTEDGVAMKIMRLCSPCTKGTEEHTLNHLRCCGLCNNKKAEVAL